MADAFATLAATAAITAGLPADLRHDHTAARGAFREATKALARYFSKAQTVARIEGVLAQGPNIFSQKGIDRLSAKITAAIGVQHLRIMAQKVSPRINLAIIAAFAVEPNTIELFDIEITAAKAGGQRHRQVAAGKISTHAAVRFLERYPSDGHTIEKLAHAGAETVRFALGLRQLKGFAAAAVPVPDAGGKLIAMVRPADAVVTTFLKASDLGPRRKEWHARFMAMDAISAKTVNGYNTSAVATRAIAMINEGAEIFQETAAFAADQEAA